MCSVQLHYKHKRDTHLTNLLVFKIDYKTQCASLYHRICDNTYLESIPNAACIDQTDFHEMDWRHLALDNNGHFKIMFLISMVSPLYGTYCK